MGKCEFCGEEVVLPFQCSFCKGYFCIDHRLPENHMCLRTPPRTPLGHWKAKKPRERPIFSLSSRKHEEKRPADYVKVRWKKRPKLKIHAFGLIAGALALISLMLPWWYFQMSTSALGVSFSSTVTADLHKVMISTKLWGEGGQIPYVVESTAMNMRFAQIALDLIVVGGILAIVGGIISGRIGKGTLIFAGILISLSIIVYAYGLQNELPKLTDELINYPYNLKDFPEIQLFSSGAYSHPDFPVPSWNYSSYLHVGFWVDLIVTILAFISASRHHDS